jgi:hypothetical protein
VSEEHCVLRWLLQHPKLLPAPFTGTLLLLLLLLPPPLPCLVTVAQDVRSMVPQAFEVHVIQMDNPASAACESWGWACRVLKSGSDASVQG